MKESQIRGSRNSVGGPLPQVVPTELVWDCPGQSGSRITGKMNSQVTGNQGVNGDRMERVTAVGASMFRRPVWTQAYNKFIQAADRATWVRERLAEVDYNPVGVPEGGPTSRFV